MHRGASLSLSFPHWEARRFPAVPCRLRLPRRLAPVGLRRSEKRARLYAPGQDVGKPAAVELTRARLDKLEGGATGGGRPHGEVSWRKRQAGRPRAPRESGRRTRGPAARAATFGAARRRTACGAPSAPHHLSQSLVVYLLPSRPPVATGFIRSPSTADISQHRAPRTVWQVATPCRAPGAVPPPPRRRRDGRRPRVRLARRRGPRRRSVGPQGPSGSRAQASTGGPPVCQSISRIATIFISVISRIAKRNPSLPIPEPLIPP